MKPLVTIKRELDFQGNPKEDPEDRPNLFVSVTVDFSVATKKPTIIYQGRTENPTWNGWDILFCRWSGFSQMLFEYGCSEEDLDEIQNKIIST